MGRTKKDLELSNTISFCKEAMSNQQAVLNTTHNAIDSNAIDVSVYNPSLKSDYNLNGSFLASMQIIPSPPTNAPFGNALHPSSNAIANYNNFLHSFNLNNTPTNPSLNLMDFFDVSTTSFTIRLIRMDETQSIQQI